MLATRANYVFNIVWVIFMLFLAAVITVFTEWAADARDESALIWEDSCVVSDMIRKDGAVELRCSPSDDGVVLASYRSTHVALIGNMPIGERADVPATCRNYQSGRWTCLVGDEEGFQHLNNVTPAEE